MAQRLTVAGGPADATLILRGNTTLSGSGEVVLGGSDPTHSYVLTLPPGGGPATRLTLAGHTLRGAGTLSGFKLTNNGRLLAEQAQGLTLLLTAGTDSLLNAGGVIEIAPDSRLAVDIGTVSGGTLLGGANSRLTMGSGLLRDLTLDGSLTVGNGGRAVLGGTVNNLGRLVFEDRGLSSQLLVQGALTLAGTGTTEFVVDRPAGEVGVSIIANPGSPAATLTVAADHTLRGSGLVQLAGVTNLGRFVADGAQGMQVLLPSTARLVNRGRMEVADESLWASTTTMCSGRRRCTATCCRICRRGARCGW